MQLLKIRHRERRRHESRAAADTSSVEIRIGVADLRGRGDLDRSRCTAVDRTLSGYSTTRHHLATRAVAVDVDYERR